MHLIIDQGNTFTKVGLFDGHDLVHADRFSDDQLQAFFSSYENLNSTACFFSTVRADASVILDHLPHAQAMSSSNKLPFEVEYATPQTLGTDRLADIAGGLFLHPKKNILVIDLGTCITYNVAVNDTFVGGAISPGIRSKLRAMHEFTGKLPLIENYSLPATNAQNTIDSMLNGAVRGTLAEVKGMVHFFCNENGPLDVIVTGGDASLLAEHHESPIFAVPFLTLIGLNEIFLFNSN
jgi:type III pantothenate kinase